MHVKDYALLTAIIMETAGALQKGPPVGPTAIDDWCEIHDELVRAMKIISAEIERLA